MRSGAKDIDYVYDCHNATMTKNMLFAKSKRPHLQDPLINISNPSYWLGEKEHAVESWFRGTDWTTIQQYHPAETRLLIGGKYWSWSWSEWKQIMHFLHC